MESPEFKPKDEADAARVRDSFALQAAVGRSGASLAELTPGRGDIRN